MTEDTAEKKTVSTPVPHPLPHEAIQYAIPIGFPSTYVMPIGFPISYQIALSPVPVPLPGESIRYGIPITLPDKASTYIIPVPQPVPGTYVIPITFPDKASTFFIPIGLHDASLGASNPVPFPIPGAGYVMTPVIPVPAPHERYLDEDQKKTLLKMELDLKIDLMNGQLELMNRFAQKQMYVLKRVKEMIKQKEN